MVAIPRVTFAGKPLATKEKKARLEDFFPLALDTLGKLALIPHEINDNGFPFIPRNLKLDNITEREGELLGYVSNAYILNKGHKLTDNGKQRLNLILEKLAIYNPVEIMRTDIAYIDRLDLFKHDAIATLTQRDPRFALSLITARDCGLNHSEKLTRRGSLNLISVLTKHLEFNISNAYELNGSLHEGLSALSITRKVLEKVKDKELDREIRETAIKLDHEIELLEEFALYKCNELKKELKKGNERISA